MLDCGVILDQLFPFHLMKCSYLDNNSPGTDQESNVSFSGVQLLSGLSSWKYMLKGVKLEGQKSFLHSMDIIWAFQRLDWGQTVD